MEPPDEVILASLHAVDEEVVRSLQAEEMMETPDEEILQSLQALEALTEQGPLNRLLSTAPADVLSDLHAADGSYGVCVSCGHDGSWDHA